MDSPHPRASPCSVPPAAVNFTSWIIVAFLSGYVVFSCLHDRDFLSIFYAISNGQHFLQLLSMFYSLMEGAHHLVQILHSR
ncbi:hypothetical protein F0562_026762 [Nyssa sinensis]|uniref:Uncharacterized protein n=1 Tax=Nyssa sinensis TaxID=561372 RepID=A0A5J5BCG5_9ASTE|nr:hypothetical protein F0562_026762 [Nyssa sinensis]